MLMFFAAAGDSVVADFADYRQKLAFSLAREIDGIFKCAKSHDKNTTIVKVG